MPHIRRGVIGVLLGFSDCFVFLLWPPIAYVRIVPFSSWNRLELRTCSPPQACSQMGTNVNTHTLREKVKTLYVPFFSLKISQRYTIARRRNIISRAVLGMLSAGFSRDSGRSPRVMKVEIALKSRSHPKVIQMPRRLCYFNIPIPSKHDLVTTSVHLNPVQPGPAIKSRGLPWLFPFRENELTPSFSEIKKNII